MSETNEAPRQARQLPIPPTEPAREPSARVTALTLIARDEPEGRRFFAHAGYRPTGANGESVTTDALGNPLHDLPCEFECPLTEALQLERQGLVRLL